MKSFLSILATSFSILIASAQDDAAVAGAIAGDKARAAAMLSADTNALKKILADDFNYTHSNGFLESKTSHIKSYVDGLRYTKFQTSKVVAHQITPDVIVLNGIIDQTKGAGKMTDYHLLFQSVWRKKGNDWQIVSLQTAAPPEPKR